MPNVVVDASTLVGAALKSGSVPDRTLRYIGTAHTLVLSPAVLDEVTAVLYRPKFDRYLTQDERAKFLAYLSAVAVFHGPADELRACRDPKDDIYLSLAVSAGADAIVSSDDDLLCLSPFRGIPILTPRAFLERAIIG